MDTLDGEDLTDGECAAGHLLAQVTDQDVERDEDGRLRIRRGVAKNRIISVTDPEMRHGRKSKNKCFDGYKAHVGEEPETELITGVAVGQASEHDGERLSDVTDAGVDTLIGDGAYGAAEVRAKMSESGVRVVAPQGPSGGTGLFTKAVFHIDLDEQTCRCPAGITAVPMRRKDGAVRLFEFPRDEWPGLHAQSSTHAVYAPPGDPSQSRAMPA